MSTPSLFAVFAFLLLAAWTIVWLRSRFGNDETEDLPVADLADWPKVVAIVPARDEAAVIAQSLQTLLAQDYPGTFRIVLVDDESTDGTAAVAAATPNGSPRLSIVQAGPRPLGWTGKLWAVSRGIVQAGSEKWLWLTDADIAHEPSALRMLVARAERDQLVLNSRMALLRTANAAERMIVPAFVWFFHLLYPFGRTNDPRSRVAAAAGGCMLIDRSALERAGGVAAIRGALIDDVSMGALLKAQGRIRLALTRSTWSLRAYGWRELWEMITRSAYTQLRFSPWLLGTALVLIISLFWGPVFLIALRPGYWPIIIFPLISFGRFLHLYRLSELRVFALPFIALFYAAATIASAVQHWRGRGGMWKGRAQAMAPPA